MSERERWIVYPLLFFALGAAVRDKILQRVDTKEIFCESLKVIDPRIDQGRPLVVLGNKGLYIADKNDPTRILAEFGTTRHPNPNNDEEIAILKVDRFLCEGLYIADEQDPTNILVELGTATAPALHPGDTPKRVGVLSLRDNEKTQVTEVRADQVLGTRIACDQLHVLDPNKRSRIIAGTQPVLGPSDGQGETTVGYEGVIILNNVPLTARPQRMQQSSTEATQ